MPVHSCLSHWMATSRVLKNFMFLFLEMPMTKEAMTMDTGCMPKRATFRQ